MKKILVIVMAAVIATAVLADTDIVSVKNNNGTITVYEYEYLDNGYLYSVKEIATYTPWPAEM